MFSDSTGVMTKSGKLHGVSDSRLVVLHPQTLNVQSQQFECDNYDNDSTTKLLTKQQFRGADKGNSSVALINRSTGAISPTMLTEEETQSLGNYEIRVNINASPSRSKTSLFRKSNMSQILGRESRVLQKLKQRVEMQYKLIGHQRSWQEDGIKKGPIKKNNFQTRSTMQMSEQNNYEAAGPRNIIINKNTAVGHHTFNSASEENKTNDGKTKTPTDKEEARALTDREGPLLKDQQNKDKDNATPLFTG